MNQSNLQSQLKNCYKSKPSKLVMSELKWKLMTRCALRGKNIVLIGPTGCGKTLAAECLAESLGRGDKFFKINLGASQDPDQL